MAHSDCTTKKKKKIKGKVSAKGELKLTASEILEILEMH